MKRVLKWAGYGLGGGTGGDGGPALSAAVAGNNSVACDDSGNTYMAMGSADVIRKVNAAGIISTVAGTGVAGFSGDGGPALAAEMNNVAHIAMYNGSLYVADMYNNRIRRIEFKAPAPTGVMQVNRANVLIFPNPASGVVTISAPVAIRSAVVRSISGEVVATSQVTGNARQAAVDICDLAPGIYHVMINDADAGSFVKQ